MATGTQFVAISRLGLKGQIGGPYQSVYSLVLLRNQTSQK